MLDQNQEPLGTTSETALDESQKLYKTLIAAMPDVVMRFAPDGRHLFVSDNVTNIVDISPDKFIGKTHQELGFPEQMCHQWESTIKKVVETGRLVESEFSFEGKNGPIEFDWRLIPELDSAGKAKSILSIARDITGLRKMERDYQTLFNEMLDGCAVHEIICDSNNKPVDYRFLAVNPAFEHLTGLGQDIVGKTVLEVMPQIESHWIETYGNVAQTGEPVLFENYSAPLKKFFKVTAFRPSPGQFATIFVDVTDQKMLEDKLRQSEKMEAIGHLAGGIAHDFNNMLGGILGYAEMSLEEVDEGSCVYKNLKQILKASDRARHLVNQILTFSRKSQDVKSSVYIKPIVKEAYQLLRASLPATIDIQVNLQSDTLPVLADATKIHEVIMNLCTNAAHAMNEKGVLEIQLSEQMVPDDKPGRLGTIDSGFYSVIRVSDNGSGMDDTTLQHIFEPFFTTKETGQGTGMGLAVVFGVLQSHSGNISVQSSPGTGTTFELYLPKTEQPVELEIEVHTPITGGSERILFVDDEDVMGDLVYNVLTNLGYTLSVYKEPAKALTAFKESPEVYDLLLTDQTMPCMTGYELAREVLSIRDDIPVILCTGYSKSINQKIAHEGGIKYLIKKPFRKRELAETIRSAIDTGR